MPFCNAPDTLNFNIRLKIPIKFFGALGLLCRRRSGAKREVTCNKQPCSINLAGGVRETNSKLIEGGGRNTNG